MLVHVYLCACVWVLRTKKAQQVGCSVDLGHGRLGALGQDLSVLGSLELVEQLGAQHDVEVLPDPSNHLSHRILPENDTGEPALTISSVKETHNTVDVQGLYDGLKLLKNK